MADLNSINQAFRPLNGAAASTVTLNAGTSSTNVALPAPASGQVYDAAQQFQIYNSGTVPVFMDFDTTSARTVATVPNGAAAGSICIPPGLSTVTVPGNPGFAAGITASSTATLYITPGFGGVMGNSLASSSGGGGGSGTVTSVSVVSANGLAGTVATATTTPAITLSTTITGILQGNGTAISAATTTGTGAVVLATSPTLVTPALGTPSAINLTNATGLPAASVSYGTPVAATAATTQNNYAPTGFGPGKMLQITPAAGGSTFTGFSSSGWSAGQTAIVCNQDTTVNNLTFPNQSASSSAGNQFFNNYLQPVYLNPGASASIVWDGTYFRFY